MVRLQWEFKPLNITPPLFSIKRSLYKGQSQVAELVRNGEKFSAAGAVPDRGPALLPDH